MVSDTGRLTPAVGHRPSDDVGGNRGGPKATAIDLLRGEFPKPETGCEQHRADQGKDPGWKAGEGQLSWLTAHPRDARCPDALHLMRELLLQPRLGDRGRLIRR